MNVRPVHLLHIDNGEEPTNLEEGLPDAQFFAIKVFDEHFSYIIHFITTGSTPTNYTVNQKKDLVSRATDFTLITSQLYKLRVDEVLRRYVPEFERRNILAEAHGGVTRGNYSGKTTA